jgi:hypothetical protein
MRRAIGFLDAVGQLAMRRFTPTFFLAQPSFRRSTSNYCFSKECETWRQVL